MPACIPHPCVTGPCAALCIISTTSVAACLRRRCSCPSTPCAFPPAGHMRPRVRRSRRRRRETRWSQSRQHRRCLESRWTSHRSAGTTSTGGRRCGCCRPPPHVCGRLRWSQASVVSPMSTDLLCASCSQFPLHGGTARVTGFALCRWTYRRSRPASTSCPTQSSCRSSLPAGTRTSDGAASAPAMRSLPWAPIPTYAHSRTLLLSVYPLADRTGMHSICACARTGGSARMGTTRAGDGRATATRRTRRSGWPRPRCPSTSVAVPATRTRRTTGTRPRALATSSCAPRHLSP